MEDNKQLEQVASGTEQSDNSIDYIEAIKEIKNNSVKKEDYNKLKEEHKKLLNAVVNGEQIKQEQAVNKPSLKELRERFRTAESTLDGVTAALEMRKLLMEEGKEDPFLPSGKKIVVTEEDRITANRVAEGFAHCVEYADGDPHVFANELSRITVDTGSVPRRKNNKRR